MIEQAGNVTLTRFMWSYERSQTRNDGDKHSLRINAIELNLQMRCDIITIVNLPLFTWNCIVIPTSQFNFSSEFYGLKK